MRIELDIKFSYFWTYFKFISFMKRSKIAIIGSVGLMTIFLSYYLLKNSEEFTESNGIAGAASKVSTSLKGLGCLVNNENNSKEHAYNFSQMAFPKSQNASGLLKRYSLEEYLPEIGDQGDVGSCVGWATAYYGLTIVKRIEKGKDYPEFSALSVFNRFCYLKGLDPCGGGSYIDGCLSLLVTKGCPFVRDYDKPNCSVDANNKRYNDCLFSFERLQHNNVNQLKLSLANNCPVVIGLEVFVGGLGNNLNSKFLDSNGVAKMEVFRTSKYPVGGHALCVIGYDDNVGGGAFKIANSWGKNWGKSGFFWLRYKDLDMVRCAFSLFTNSVLDKNKVNSIFKTSALNVYNETAGNLYLALGYDTPKGIQTKGWFRIEAGLSRNIDISQRSSKGVYYILMDEEGNVLEGKSKDKSLPLKKISFDLNEKDEGSEESSSYQYSEWLPSNKKTIQSVKVHLDNNEYRLVANR
jgi:C1A family cysteine protease